MKNFLKIADKIIDKKASVPVLAKMHVERNQLQVTDTSIFASYPHETQKLRGVVDFERFKKLYDGKKPALFLKDSIKIGNAKLIASNSEFPIMEFKPTKQRVKISIEWLHKMHDKVAFAMSSEETRYYLNGIYFDEQCAVATDGHRLAKMDYDGFKLTKSFIMPKKVVELIPFLQSDVELLINKDASKAQIKCDDGLIITFKTIDGKFPDYERVIPESGSKYSFAAKDIITACKTVKKAGDRHQPGIKITQEGLTYESSDREFYYELPKYNAIEFNTGFNFRHLQDIASKFNDDESVLFEQEEGGRPARIEQKSVVYVLMPMRV